MIPSAEQVGEGDDDHLPASAWPTGMEPVDLAEKGEPMYDFEEHEREARLMLNAPLYEAPGARHGAATSRIHRPKPKASRQRLPGRSVHAERKAAEKAATEKAKPLTLDSFKVFAAQAAEVAAQRAAGTRKEQQLTSGAIDFKWYLNHSTGEAEYRAFTDPYGIAWEER